MRRLGILIVLTALVAPATAPLGGRAEHFGPVIRVGPDAFGPDLDNPPAGSTVRWDWADPRNQPHTVTSYLGQAFDSGPRTSGSFSITYDGQPTAYRCRIHSTVSEDGRCDGMCGILEDDSQAPPPPAITSPVPDAVLGDGVVRVSGTSTADTTSVVLLVDGEHIWSSYGHAGGPWSATVGVLNGTHSLSARGFDRFYNASEPSTATTITVEDTQAPEPPALVSPEAGSRVESYTTTLSGMVGTDALRIRVYTEAGLQEGPTEDGAFSFGAYLGPGPATLELSAVDAVGNESARTEPILLMVDGSEPSVTLDSPTHMRLARNPVQIRGTAHDDASMDRVEVSILDRSDGTTETHVATCPSCGKPGTTWTYTAPLSPGLYEMRATGYDWFGRSGESQTILVLVV